MYSEDIILHAKPAASYTYAFLKKILFSSGYIGFSVFDVNGISLLSLDRDYFLFFFFLVCFLILSFVFHDI